MNYELEMGIFTKHLGNSEVVPFFPIELHCFIFLHVTNHNELGIWPSKTKNKSHYKYLACIQMIYIGANKGNRKTTFSYNHGQIPT